MDYLNNKLKLSIITVNYNGFEDTCDLLESLRDNLQGNYEVIVVDNASFIDEGHIIEQKHPEVKVICSSENLGFAGGNNLAVDVAVGEYLLFINNDTFIEDDYMWRLVDFMDSNRDAGGVSPKIKFAFGDRNIQFAGYTPLTKTTLRNALIGFNQPDSGCMDNISVTPFLHGAAMMIRRDVINRVGKMCESFFLYYEELDWCERIRNVGYKLYYAPLATVYHKESRSTGIDSPLKMFYMTRNRLLFAKRNRKGVVRAGAYIYQLFVSFPKSFVLSMIKRRFDLCKASFKGVIAFLLSR